MSIKLTSLLIVLALVVFVTANRDTEYTPEWRHHHHHHRHHSDNSESPDTTTPSDTKSCPPNQEFRANGPPLQCERCGPKCRSLQNIPQCYCKSNYSRIASGDCIHNTDCAAASSCPVNQQYQLSGSACQGCGANKCLAIIDKAQCYCSPQFNKSPNGDCIPSADCPAALACPEGSVYKLIGPDGCEGCEIRCDLLANIPKCYCSDGYSRVNDVCVPNAQCSNKV